ncbi:MAG TPA: nitroreductase family deazaflavin-dependent oxidoreductase [Jatrophihabitans sp.]|nr:nitroreductase family deazaflavin-dependent oxidoreductase [Jatrophihabitans sp.]
MTDYNEQIIAEFRAHHGQVGGNFEGAPMLLLHSRGARSGQPRVHPMMYLANGGDSWYVFASKAGADSHPAWYHNLKAHPQTRIELGDDLIEVSATEVTGARRDEIYAEQARRYPGFAEYEQKTDRVIPVLELSRVR